MNDRDHPEGVNVQEAPYPHELADLVGACTLDPGWRITLVPDMDRGQGSKGLTVVITVLVFDALHPDRDRTYRVNHYFPVPAASYNRYSWQRWLFDRYQEVLQHEGQEMFQIAGKQPYAPLHGPGYDPYIVPQYATKEQLAERYNAEDPREVLKKAREVLNQDHGGALGIIRDLREVLA